MKITKITVLQSREGRCQLILHTDLPSATRPYDESPSLHLEVASSQGEAYCAANFPGIPVEVVWH